jgi:hypothetical protein
MYGTSGCGDCDWEPLEGGVCGAGGVCVARGGAGAGAECGGARRCTPSMSCACDGVVLDGSAGSEADCAFWRGERPGKGELVALARWASRARLLSEFDRTMLIFSASIPLMFGIVGLRGGGVGGMSPVMVTSASTPALRSLKAACGETLNMSSLWSATVGDGAWSEAVASCSFGSAAGTGGGGGEWTEFESLPLLSSRADVDGSGTCSSAISEEMSLLAHGVGRNGSTRVGIERLKGGSGWDALGTVARVVCACRRVDVRRLFKDRARPRASSNWPSVSTVSYLQQELDPISWSRVFDCFFLKSRLDR